ncbi:C39 family peptidase [Candidatus Poribacteria bacterium]|nr:C39 family peptidase [Candidatus Poribacteria bacterium]
MQLLKKPHQQQINHEACVPASLSMVCAAYGKTILQSEFIEQLMRPPRRGTSFDSLEDPQFQEWLKQYGLTLEIRESNLDQLRSEIRAGIPVICIIQSQYLPYSFREDLHAVVIVGIDSENVYLNDPLLSEDTITVLSIPIFLKAWEEWGGSYRIRVHPI